MYAVIKVQGKQYRVQSGDIIHLDKLKLKPGDTMTFDEVLMISDNKQVDIGAPIIKDASVDATVIETIKGEKIRVVKFRRRKRYRRTYGHRQQYTQVKIDQINYQ